MSAIAAALACALVATRVTAAPPDAPVHVTIVHTNDLHAHVENAAAIAAIARAERARNPNTLFLDAGDAVTGTPVSTVFKGDPVFAIMTRMGYDAAAVGNHEFDHGWASVARYREIAAHPLLCANAWAPDGAAIGDAPSHVFTVGGVKIGVIGLLTGDVAGSTTKANWAGCRVEPPLETARRLVPELRATCDVVVLLTHVGVEVDAAIAGAVPGIDLVVGGHSHTQLGEPILVACGDRKVPVVQAFRYGERVGVVEFDVDRAAKTIAGFKGRLVKVDAKATTGADDVAELVAAWHARTEEKAGVGVVIGRAKTRLRKENLRAVLEDVYREVTGADLAFQNMGGVRDEIAAGEIKVGSVWNVLPFENTLVILRVRGERLPAFARKRLGASFDPAKEYALATNSYVADQQKKYFGFDDVPVEETGIPMREAVVDWVRAHGGFAGDGTPPARGLDEGERQ